MKSGVIVRGIGKANREWFKREFPQEKSLKGFLARVGIKGLQVRRASVVVSEVDGRTYVYRGDTFQKHFSNAGYR